MSDEIVGAALDDARSVWCHDGRAWRCLAHSRRACSACKVVAPIPFGSAHPQEARFGVQAGAASTRPRKPPLEVLATLLVFVLVNGLLIAGGGMLEAGADGLTSPGYDRSRSLLFLILGLVAWVALATFIFVTVRRAKTKQANTPDTASRRPSAR